MFPIFLRPLRSHPSSYSWNTIPTFTLPTKKVLPISSKENLLLNNKSSWKNHGRSLSTTIFTESTSDPLTSIQKNTPSALFNNPPLPLNSKNLKINSSSSSSSSFSSLDTTNSNQPNSQRPSSFLSSCLPPSSSPHPSSLDVPSTTNATINTADSSSSSSSLFASSCITTPSSTPLLPPSSFQFDLETYLNHPSIPLPPVDPASNLYLQTKRAKMGQAAQDALVSNSCAPNPEVLNSLLTLNIYEHPKEAWEMYCQLTMRSKDSFVPTLCPWIPESCHLDILRAMKRFLNHAYAQLHDVHLPIYVVRTRIEYILETMRLHHFPLPTSELFILIDLYGRSAMYHRMEFWLDHYFQAQLGYDTKLMNSVLSGYVNSVQPHLAESWYHQCLAKGVTPNRMTFALFLRLYFRTRNLKAALLMGELAYPKFLNRSLSSSSSFSPSAVAAAPPTTTTTTPPSTSDKAWLTSVAPPLPSENAFPSNPAPIHDFDSFVEAIPRLTSFRNAKFVDPTSRGLDQAAGYWIMLIGTFHLQEPALQKVLWEFIGYVLLRPEINVLFTLNAIVYTLCCQNKEVAAESMVQKFTEFQVQPNSSTYNHLLKMYGKLGRLEKLNELGLFLFNGSTRFSGAPNHARPFLHTKPKFVSLLNPLSLELLCHFNTGAELHFWQKVKSANRDLRTRPCFLRFRLSEKTFVNINALQEGIESKRKEKKEEIKEEPSDSFDFI